MAYFNFQIKVVIHTKHKKLTYVYCKDAKRSMEIHFTIPFTNETEPNISEISIYNMNKHDFNRIKKGTKVELYAGYTGHVSLVTKGRIYRTTVPTVDDADVEYTLRVIEGKDYTKMKKVKKSFKKRTHAKTMIHEICKKAGIKLNLISLYKNKLYKSSNSIDDHPISALEDLADDCKTSLYYDKGHLTMKYAYDKKKEHVIKLSPANGLITTPEKESRDDDWEGKSDNDELGRWSWDVESIFNPHIHTFAKVHVKSRYVSTTMMVLNGEHSFDGENPRTKFEGVTK